MGTPGDGSRKAGSGGSGRPRTRTARIRMEASRSASSFAQDGARALRRGRRLPIARSKPRELGVRAPRRRRAVRGPARGRRGRRANMFAREAAAIARDRGSAKSGRAVSAARSYSPCRYSRRRCARRASRRAPAPPQGALDRVAAHARRCRVQVGLTTRGFEGEVRQAVAHVLAGSSTERPAASSCTSNASSMASSMPRARAVAAFHHALGVELLVGRELIGRPRRGTSPILDQLAQQLVGLGDARSASVRLRMIWNRQVGGAEQVDARRVGLEHWKRSIASRR